MSHRPKTELMGNEIIGRRSPTVYAATPPGTFARLLASVASVVDIEPSGSFADEAVVAEGEALLRCLHDRFGESGTAGQRWRRP